MKKQNQGYLTQVTQMELQKLTTLTEEKLATACKQDEKKVFSSADLWNIQRNKRAFVQRRFIM